LGSISTYVNDHPFIKHSYELEWKLAASHLSQEFIDSMDNGKEIQRGYINRCKKYKEILPSKAYELFWNQMTKRPIKYKKIDELYDTVSSAPNTARDDTVRGHIKNSN
jgi:hypothetical protein